MALEYDELSEILFFSHGKYQRTLSKIGKYWLLGSDKRDFVVHYYRKVDEISLRTRLWMSVQIESLLMSSTQNE